MRNKVSPSCVLLAYLLTYLLTPLCRVLLEKLTGLQLVKKFPIFHGTRRFITALTSVRHLALSWARPIQSIYPHPTSWRSILILSTHLRLGLPSGFLPSGFLSKTLYTPSSHPYAPHVLGIKICSFGDKDMNSNQITDSGPCLPSHKSKTCPTLIESEFRCL